MRVKNDQESLTAGEEGPVLLSDAVLIDKVASFSREKINERVVFAHGSGAHGHFELVNDMSQYTRAKFLTRVGEQTPVFVRFSSAGCPFSA